jgi:hypothetical protein
MRRHVPTRGKPHAAGTCSSTSSVDACTLKPGSCCGCPPRALETCPPVRRGGRSPPGRTLRRLGAKPSIRAAMWVLAYRCVGVPVRLMGYILPYAAISPSNYGLGRRTRPKFPARAMPGCSFLRQHRWSSGTSNPNSRLVVHDSRVPPFVFVRNACSATKTGRVSRLLALRPRYHSLPARSAKRTSNAVVKRQLCSRMSDQAWTFVTSLPPIFEGEDVESRLARRSRNLDSRMSEIREARA